MLGDEHSVRTERVKAGPARPYPGEEAEKKKLSMPRKVTTGMRKVRQFKIKQIFFKKKILKCKS